MRDEEEVTRAIGRHADTVRRLCAVHLANRSDIEDVFQDVFLKYALSDAPFSSEEHERAWVIRVTLNACKDQVKRASRRHDVSLDAAYGIPADVSEESREVLAAVKSLPEKYRNVVYLHFYEGYTAPEIAELLGKNANTVYTLITRSKKLLREKLGGE